MKILSIASILPVPEIYKENDYVFTLSHYIEKEHPSVKYSFLKPSSFFPFRKDGKWKERNKVSKMKIYQYGPYSVNILPFFAIAVNDALFAILSYTTILFNKQILRKNIENIDCVHAHYILPDGLIALYLKKHYNIPYILTLHGEHRWFSTRISKHISNKILKQAGTIVSISPMMKHYLETNAGYSTVKFIGHGVERSFFTVKRLPSKDKFINILTIGVLTARKNIIKVIHAIIDLTKTYNIRFTIVGDGPEAPDIENLIETFQLQNTIKLIKYLPHEELPLLMSSQDIFILVSHFDTWGRVYIEAMATGLPVILTKSAGVYGIIRENVHALIANPNSEEDIKQKLEFLIKYPEKRIEIGNNGKKIASEMTWERIARKYFDIYSATVL